MSDIPNGADQVVARMAIAWEIAKEARALSSSTRGGAVSDDTGWVDVQVELFNRAYNGLKGKAKAG